MVVSRLRDPSSSRRMPNAMALTCWFLPSAVTGGVIDVYRHPMFQAPWETRGLIQSDGDGTIARGRFGGDPVAALKFIQ